jgi:hypothetical protein
MLHGHERQAGPTRQRDRTRPRSRARGAARTCRCLRRTGPAEVGGAELVGPAAQSVWSEITNRTHHSDTTRFVPLGFGTGTTMAWTAWPLSGYLKPKSMSGFYNPRLFHQVLVSFDLVLFDSIHPRVIVYGHRNVIAHDLLASDSFFSFPWVMNQFNKISSRSIPVQE